MTTGKWVSAVLWGIGLYGQSKGVPCPLDAAKNGDLVTIRGEAFRGGHDMFIRPAACATSPTNRVILVWADDASLSANQASVRRDSAFREFDRLLKATLPLPPNSAGVGPSRYRILADFEGRIEVAPSAGLKRNSGRIEVAPSAGLKRNSDKTKVVRLEGYGHPMPFTRFRLLATGVSMVVSEEHLQREAEHALKSGPANPK